MPPKTPNFNDLIRAINAILSDSLSEWEKVRRGQSAEHKKQSDEYQNILAIRKPITKDTLIYKKKVSASGTELIIGDFSEIDRLFLPLLDGDYPTILMLKIDVHVPKKGAVKLRMGVEIIANSPQGEKMRWIEYRFEAPHQSTRRPHFYWHAQVSGGEDDNNWIDNTTPCIPAPVDDPTSLLFYLLGCFYGPDICRNIHTKSALDGKYLNFMRYMEKT